MTDYIFLPPAIVSLPIKGDAARYPVNRIFCVGRNYADHAREMGFDPVIDEPFFFDKPNYCLTQSDQTIPYPPATRNLHPEVELVVMLKSGGHNITTKEAHELIYGYAVGFDLTRRDLQLKLRTDSKPWDVSKAFEHSAIVGTVTKAEDFGYVQTQAIASFVNGKVVQSADLGELIFSVPQLITFLSKYYTLQAGDIIFTGTPGGVAAVEPGRTMIGKIDGLEPITVTFMDKPSE